MSVQPLFLSLFERVEKQKYGVMGVFCAELWAVDAETESLNAVNLM